MRVVLQEVVKYCKKNRVFKMIIDSEKLLHTFLDEVRTISMTEILKCVMNWDDIKSRPTILLYQGKLGKNLAAVRIQAA